jgi:WD40 repeat protein
VAWHPSGKKLASAAWDHTIRIWKTESDVSHEIRLPETNIPALAWSPLGDRLAAGGVDGLTRVFNEQGEEVVRTTDNLNMVTAVAWSSGGALATGDQNGRVQFWEADLQLSKAVDLGPDRINALRWSNDGRRLAVVSDQIRFLDPNGETVGAMEPATSPLRSIEWNRADQIATAGDDGLIRIWSKEGLQSHGIPNPAKRSRVHWNASGDKLASASWGQLIEVFDIQGNKLYTFPGHDPAAWNPIGDTIAWASGNEVRLGALGENQHTLRGHSWNVQGLAWNADGTKLASGDGSGEIRIWNSEQPVLAAASSGRGDIYLRHRSA